MKLTHKLTHSSAVMLMIAVTLMWSIAGAVTKQLESAKSFEVTFWRSFFTMISLLVILPLWQGRGVFKAMGWKSTAFWISGVCWSVMFTAFMVALTLTTVGNVLVTMATGPLLTALISRIFIGHKLPMRTWVAIAVACAGMAYMFGQQLDLKQGGALLGMAVAFCVPVAGAINWTVVQRSQGMANELAQAPSNELAQAQGAKLDFVPCVLIGAVISTLITFPLAFPFAATAKDVSWLALLGLVQLAIPCVLAVVCARVLKAPEVSLLALLEVIFGILLAWAFAGEVPSQAVLVGGALVIGALVANELLGLKKS